MFNDLSMRIFLAHLAAFVAGTLICAAVNLWLTPDTLWFPWVLIGWGAAVATHAFALLLRKTRRRERIFIDKCARSFTVHLFAYLVTVLILFFGYLHRDAEGLVVLLGGARLGRRGSSRTPGVAFSGNGIPCLRQRRPRSAKSEPYKSWTEIGRAPETKPAQAAQQEAEGLGSGDQRVGRQARIEQPRRLLGAGDREPGGIEQPGFAPSTDAWSQ